MLLSVVFPIPDFLANSIKVNRFSLLFSHNRIFTLLTSFHEEVYKVTKLAHGNEPYAAAYNLQESV